MTKLRINYNDYSAGAVPSSDFAWRQSNGSGVSASIMNSADGNLLRTYSTSPGTKVLSYKPLDNIDDVEVLTQFRLEQDYGKQGIVSLRYGGDSEANTTGYTLSGSVIGNVGKLAIDEGSTGYIVWSDWNYLPNITYWVRFRVVGSRVSAKVWTDGQSEPSAWLLDANSDHRTTGDYSGFHQYNVGWINHFYTSFGTNGDSAPNPGEDISGETEAGEARVITANDIEWQPTNNYTSGRPVPVTTIAIHWWDDPALNPSLGGVVSWFQDPNSKVSAHFVVSGNSIVQMVGLDDQAWHVVGHNTYTIGIETDPNLPPGTYESVSGLVRYLRALLNKTLPMKGHNEFSGTNTQCPGDVDVSVLQTMSAQPLPEGIETLPPTANFSASPLSGEYPLDVSFVDTTTHSPETWYWNFGDTENSDTLYNFATSLSPFTTNGNTNWLVSSGTAKAGSIGNSQATHLRLSVTMAKGGLVRFDYKVSSEVNFDYLRFYIDDIKQADWSGEIDWTTSPRFFIPEGTHVLRWSYETDTAAAVGSNTAWIDNVLISEGSPASTSYERNPVHTYTEPGTYTVSLMAVNPNGSDINIKENLITVSEPVIEPDPEDPVDPETPIILPVVSKRWIGERWDYEYVKQWDGTSWRRKRSKRWNGTEWR